MTQQKKHDLESLKVVFQEYLVTKSPIALPEAAKEFLVKTAPILVIIGIVFSIPAILTILGLGAIALPFAALGGAKLGWYSIIGLISSIVSIAISIMMLPGLSK